MYLNFFRISALCCRTNSWKWSPIEELKMHKNTSEVIDLPIETNGLLLLDLVIDELGYPLDLIELLLLESLHLLELLRRRLWHPLLGLLGMRMRVFMRVGTAHMGLLRWLLLLCRASI